MTTPDDRAARRRRLNRNILIVIGVLVGLLVVCGLIGAVFGEDQADKETAPAPGTTEVTAPAPAPEPTAAPPATSSAPAPASTCYPPTPIADPELAAFAAGLTLPPGVTVVTGRVSTDSDYPGQVGVALDLCVPGQSSADELRPIATEVARALRPTPLGERTFVLYVSDMVDGSEFENSAKIKDPDFPLHLWNGKPSAEVEHATWEVVQG